MSFELELEAAIDAAYQAMDVIMDVYRRGFEVEIKSDDSPVTEADKRSDQLIRRLLGSAFPTYAFLTEEQEDSFERLNSRFVWIIDPLDGTKDFVDHDGQFAVNIALVEDHLPVVGVVGVPATGELYGAVRGAGSFCIAKKGAVRQPIHVSRRTSDLVLLSSVYHENEEEQRLAAHFSERIGAVRHVGSAIKACLIARGEAEVSFRFNPNTKEWDTCAPQILVEEAGGSFTEPDGTKITYNRADVYNRHGFAIYNCEENNFSKLYLNLGKAR